MLRRRLTLLAAAADRSRRLVGVILIDFRAIDLVSVDRSHHVAAVVGRAHAQRKQQKGGDREQAACFKQLRFFKASFLRVDGDACGRVPSLAGLDLSRFCLPGTTSRLSCSAAARL